MKPKAVKQIPATVTHVDLKTGKETHEQGSWQVLPPSPDKCQVCAVKHEPEQPHNAQSLYYQMTFSGMVGRSPTWADALAHCSDDVKRHWKTELLLLDAWSEPPKGEPPVRHHGVG
jgi:hypothetical protein